MNLCDTLRELTSIPGLAGHEHRVARYLASRIPRAGAVVRLDPTGNLLVTVAGHDPAAPSAMVFAHMDSLGFVVRRIEPDGFVRLERLGGIPEKALPGLRVVIESVHGDLVPGVIGVKAHHAADPAEKVAVTPYADLSVDLGCASADEVREVGIEIGCPVVYEPRFTRLRGDRVSATAIDDRAGCAVLLALVQRALEQPYPSTVHFVFSVQEEYNLRGALVAANRLAPDFAVCLDLVVATDTRDLKERGDLRLGAGPTMSLYSFHGRGTLNGTIPHPALVRHFGKIAAQQGIQLQRSANLGSLTDSAYVQLSGNGVPSIDLGYPVRYTHTPVETCDLRDLEALTELVHHGLRAVDGGFDLARHGLPDYLTEEDTPR